MKKSNQFFTLACLCAGFIFLSGSAYAQPWKTNGNTVGMGDFIGSTNNADVNFRTNNIQRLQIDKNGLTHVNAIMVTDSAIFSGPVTISNGGDAFRPMPGYITACVNDILGVTTRFFDVTGVNAAGPPAPLPLKGMGINKTCPAFMLDVFCDHSVPTNLDINISSPLFGIHPANDVGYRIGGSYVLWHAGDPLNIFVGVNAGCVGLGPNNVCVGNGTENVPAITAQFSVCVGDQAGQNNQAAGETFVGYQAGMHNTTPADFNTFIGCYAGKSNTSDGNNCFVGAFSGQLTNLSNGGNAFFGTSSGSANTLGSNNTFIGQSAAPSNSTGILNVALGSGADIQNNGTNEIAIGATSTATTSNTMILGNNSVNVGIGLSGNPVGPQNKLEITTGNTPTTLNGCSATSTGFSGLRFRNLTAVSTPCSPNPGRGVLSVNSTGDVILVNENGIGAGYCSPGPLPTLIGDAGYDLNNTANFYFAGNSNGNTVNNVNIGYSCTAPATPAKLAVSQTSTTPGSIGISVENDDPYSAAGTIGLKSKLSPSPIGANFGVAGWFESTYQPGSQLAYSIFVPPASNPGFNTGIVSIGYTLGTSNGFGDFLQVNSGIDAMGTNYPSDRRYKIDITPITNAMRKIDSIKPVYFFYDTAVYHSKFNFSSKQQVGFIAQNVDSVLPQVVQKNDSGYYSLDYPRMTALLLAGMQQQQGTIDSLKNVLNSIQSCLSKLCDSSNNERMLQKNNGNNVSSNNEMNVNLSNSAILYQNTPNPFGENGTKISYFLPENTMGASIVFYDMYGTQLKTVQLTQTGMGNINLNAEKLSNGVYTYSLVVNGNVIDTKKMVYTK